jgi:hypothetical protein
MTAAVLYRPVPNNYDPAGHVYPPEADRSEPYETGACPERSRRGGNANVNPANGGDR